MCENERNIILTKEEYDTLIKVLCPNCESEIFVDYFYDTKDFEMKRKGRTYRIQFRDGKYKTIAQCHLGLDVDLGVEDNYQSYDRFNPSVYWNIGLSFCGCIITQRVLALQDLYCSIMLDCNIYLDKAEYELRLFFFPGAEERAQYLIDMIIDILKIGKHIESTEEYLIRENNSKTKVDRFFDYQICKKNMHMNNCCTKNG